jgi:hypothetical protein
MPQSSQILGVNSVTNIELDKGVLPAPIIRNADWFEKIDRPEPPTAFSPAQQDALERHGSMDDDHHSLP